MPFALLPTVFCGHQLIEAVVWLGVDGRVERSGRRQLLLPTCSSCCHCCHWLLPVSIVLLEPRYARGRVMPFVVLGAIVAITLLIAVLNGPVEGDVA